MAKKAKHTDVNLYYLNGQAQKNDKIQGSKQKNNNTQKRKQKTSNPKSSKPRNNNQQNISNIEKQKMKEREKRIKQNKIKRKEGFDEETETVIQMTNKNKIKKDEQQRKKIEQQEIKRRARNRKIKLVLKIFLLLAIIIGAGVFALVSPIFNIKEIKVVNNNVVTEETVKSLSEIKTDENIFRFISLDVIKKVKSNPYIEDVKIHRRFPSTVEIEVIEREHNFSVDFLGQYAYINNQGYILELSEDSKQKPIIQGISTKEEDVTVGNRLNNEDLEKLEDVIKIMNATKEYGLYEKVTNIEINNKNDYNIYLEQENKKIHLGDSSNLRNKLIYANAIIEQEKGKKGDIFVNGDLNNKFKAYFRESLSV